MRTRWLPILLFLFLACELETDGPEPAADAVATWNGGSLSLAEVESAFAETRIQACSIARRRGGVLEALLPCYRELAEGLALERLVLAEVDDVDAAIAALESAQELRRHILLELHQRRLQEEIEVSDAEIEAHFEANRQDYRRPGRRTLHNIFRRHRGQGSADEALAELARLKERFHAGETWSELARQHSESETRLRGGLVGEVKEGDLPPRLERVVFALDPGGVSDPIVVSGGAVLLHVTGAIEGVDPSPDELREPIRRQLMIEKIRAANDDLIAGSEPPAGAVLLAGDELLVALDGDPERMVYELGGDRLTAGRLREIAGLEVGRRAGDLDDADRERLATILDQRRQQQLLYLAVADSADAELEERGAEELRRLGRAAVVDQRLRGEMERLVDADPGRLAGYFEDNRPHYQSPLRFRLRVLDLPFGTDPPRQLRRLEELRTRIAAGEADLEAVAAELGGEIADLGWREFDALPAEIPPKARQYLLQAESGGLSVPYQQDGALHMIAIEERQEPLPLEYGEITDRVRSDYLERFERTLYRQVAEARLAAAGFVFDEAAVERLLAGDLVDEPEPAEAEPESESEPPAAIGTE